MAERIERLITLDVSRRGVIDGLAAAARKNQSGCACLAAARTLLRRLRPGQYIFLATGWHDRPQINSQVAETDGPIGAAALARVLHDVSGAVPVLLVEERLIEPMETLIRAAGFSVLEPEEACTAPGSSAPLHAASVLRFSKNLQEAETHSEQLLAAFRPRAIITIEIGGMDAEGRVYTFRGDDTTEHTPKFDQLLAAAQRRRVVTIGIGDGGNEIGFGRIHRAAVERIPSTGQAADRIVPVDSVDFLIPAAVSNWGAFGLAAAVCLAAGRPDLAYRAEHDARLMTAAGRAGLIDGISGYVEPSVDGLGSEVHQGVVSLLHALVQHGCR